MGHRHFNSFNAFEINQARIPENGSFVHQMDNMLRGEVRVSRWNSDNRGNEYTPSSFSTEVPYPLPSFSSSSSDPSLHYAAGNSYMVPESNAGNSNLSYYNRHTMHEIGGCIPDPLTSTGSGPFKRKSSGISVAYERGSTSRFYGSGSSSGTSVTLQQKPTSDYPNIMSGPIGLPHHRGRGSFSIGGEDSSRNGRSRSRIELEANPMRAHSSNYSFRHYHSTTRPTNYSGATDHTHMSGDQTTRQWNFNPLSPPVQGRILGADTNSLNHVSNQVPVRGNVAETVGYQSEFASIGHTVSSSQYPHFPPIQAAREGNANNSQRATPSYRACPSYPRLGREASSSESGWQLHSETYSSRHWPASAGGWRNSDRNVRPRIATEGFQSISRVVDAHNRMGSEALMTVDHSAFYYGSNSLFDQYRDMRLDIDDMSYEDLLALGERIGNVNTGLAGDKISKCLTETTYSYLDDNHDEGNCSVCLEEYKNEDEIGTMNKCGHSYHAVCIRKWLSMKNVCPICKAPALKDCSN